MSGSRPPANVQGREAPAKPRTGWSGPTGWRVPFPKRLRTSRALVIAEQTADWLQGQYLEECEQRRTFLWVPVIFAAGILVYFQLAREPVLPALVIASIGFSGGAMFRFRRGRTFRVWALAALVALGAVSAKIRTDLLAGPHVSEPLYASVRGTVSAIQVRADRAPRLVLSDLVIDARRPVDAPEKLRITLLKDDAIPPAGLRLSIRARFGPVPGPAVPGGYDPRRAAYFAGIGAGGFAVGRWSGEEGKDQISRSWGIRDGIQALRHSVVSRILDNEPGPAGAVAAALLVGERGYLPADAVDNLRNAGLAHILAISGLHMALFAGVVFFAVRAALALSVPLALTRPIKKWSAGAAILAGFIYLLLSGGNVATIRAFIMAAIMFGAIIADRPALSLRNLAFAALIILVLEPESVTEPGFQMSFAAVAALIAFYESWRDRGRRQLAELPTGLAGRTLRSVRVYAGTIAMTTIIAGFATGPIAAFHFNHVAVYSLLGNLLAMPIVAFVIMPAGLLSLVFMPFGLEQWPLAAMAQGTTLILDIAAMVGGREGASVTVPSVSPGALLVFMSGFLWICLWRQRWRWLGIAPIMFASVLLPVSRQSPDILVASSGTMVGVRDISGALRVSARRTNQYTLEQWFRRDGQAVPERVALSKGVRCDRSACLLRLANGRLVAHIRHHSAFMEECRKDVIIITPLTAPEHCSSPLIIDAAQLERFGAHAISVNESSRPGEHDTLHFQVKTAFPRVRRPWHGAGPVQ